MLSEKLKIYMNFYISLIIVNKMFKLEMSKTCDVKRNIGVNFETALTI